MADGTRRLSFLHETDGQFEVFEVEGTVVGAKGRIVHMARTFVVSAFLQASVQDHTLVAVERFIRYGLGGRRGSFRCSHVNITPYPLGWSSGSPPHI